MTHDITIPEARKQQAQTARSDIPPLDPDRSDNMASMEDLVATVSGSMHVSQERYDLQNFRDYLAQNMVVPSQMSQPGFLPPSRSTSTTRKTMAMPQPVTTPNHQPYPSPVPHNSYTDYGAVRPGGSLQRQTSYGFGRPVELDGMDEAGPSSPMSYDAFASDAFAPLKRPHDEAADPWARMKQASAFGQQQHQQSSQQQQAGPSNPWAAFGRSTNGFAAGVGVTQQQHQRARMPTPPDEDDEMMSEDEIDDGFAEEERRYGSSHALAAAGGAFGEAAEKRALSMNGLDEQDRVAALWQRGRRKT